MTRSRLAFVVAIAIAALLVAAVPASAIRYAAPTAQGTGSCSSPANACTVSDAVEGGGSVPSPGSGEEIVVLPGEHVLPDMLQPAGTLSIHGQDGSPRPTLRLSSASTTTVFSSLGSSGTLRHLRIHADNNGAATAALLASGAATYADLEIVATGASLVGVSLANGALLRDSTIRVEAQFGVGARVLSATTNKLLNATVVATGSDSNGISVYDFGSGGTNENWKLTAVNSIVDGGLRDILVHSSNAADNLVVDTRNSNYGLVTMIGAGAHFNELGGNQTTSAPVFANLAGGDFHQLLGSPTIDAGFADPQLGPTDFDGNARTLGSAPDIGADEYEPPSSGGGGGGSVTPPPNEPGPIPACSTRKSGTRAADRLFGTGGGDLLIAGRGKDLLRGRAGDDCLHGEGGKDRLEGGDGNDKLFGGADADNLAGGRGTDLLDGGPGADRLAGEGGKDAHRAGPGADIVSAADGTRELVDCGSGRDVARVDRTDRVIRCERVQRIG